MSARVVPPSRASASRALAWLALASRLVGVVPAAWSRRAPGPALAGHAAATVGASVVVFGGMQFDEDGACRCSDRTWLHVGDRWMALPTGDRGPSARAHASAAVLDGALYVFGGRDPVGERATRTDVWALDLASLEWRRAAHWPSAALCSAHALDDNRALLCARDGLFVFDARAARVRAQPTGGRAPPACSLSASWLCGTRLIRFGGADDRRRPHGAAHALDVRNWTWSEWRSDGDAPSPRASACCVSTGGAGGGLLFGGAGVASDGRLVPHDDTYAFTVDATRSRLMWSRLRSDHDAPPSARVGASMTAVGGSQIVMHGGWDPTQMRAFDDTFALALQG